MSSTSRTRGNTTNIPYDQTVTFPNTSHVTDTLQLTSNAVLYDFPLSIVLADWGEQAYFPMNVLGMGSNASIYRALLSTKQIASRSWSMFWGLHGPNKHTQLDGSFVIGGYDNAKVIGQNYTLPLVNDNDCGTRMVVAISDLILNFANGTNASLFNGTHNVALNACVDPSYPVLMTLPLPYFKVFQNFTNQPENGFNRTFGVAFYSMIYNDTINKVYVHWRNTNVFLLTYHSYNGDLTIKLSSGLSVRIPNDQLIVPERVISQSGEIVANTSSPNLVINVIKELNTNDQLHLGRQFLSAAYVMMNEDTSSFTMWQANPTHQQELIAVDEHNIPLIANCSANKQAYKMAESSKKKLGAAAIAGTVLGSAAVIIFGVAVFFGFKRQKADVDFKQPLEQQSPVELENLSPRQKQSSYHVEEVFEVSSPKELHSKDENHELRMMYELPVGRDDSKRNIG